MYAYQGNLLDPNDPDPREFSSFDFQLFDIAVVGLGFHHFDDPALAAKRLVERLRPGGVLLILDFLPHGKVADVRLHVPEIAEQGKNLPMLINKYRTATPLRIRSRTMASPRNRSRRSSKMLAPARTLPWRLLELPSTRPPRRDQRRSADKSFLRAGPKSK